MGLRDHEPFVIEQFNGLWDRGDDESCPSDHFLVADNIQFFESGFETRDPLNKWQNTTGLPLKFIRRIHNYVMQDGQSLLVMVANGNIYHIIRPNSVPFLVASFPGASDFNMVSIAGRAYITPFVTLVDVTGQTYQLGVPNEYVHVYHGDGITPARRTGGAAPSNGDLKPLIAFNSASLGSVTRGIHQFIVVFNGTNTYSPPVRVVVDAPGNEKIQLINLPIGPVGTLSRTIAMTLAIDPKDYSFDSNFAFYSAFVIPDNVTVDIKIDITDDVLKNNSLVNFGNQTGPFPMMVANVSAPGFCDVGFHIVAVVYETDTGYLTGPGPKYYAANTYVDINKKVGLFVIPTSPDPFVKKRHVISTKAITDYNGDQAGYQFFFVPGATIENNLDTSILFSYYDSDLVDDASHLLDNYVNIPAGVNLNTYHGRMIVVGVGTLPDLVASPHSHIRPDNRSVALLSAPGEPEAISKVDGLIITPLDGNPLTNAQEFRDILYLFKRTRTYAYSDNFDEPSTWQEEVLDQGIGAPVHGIGTVLDSGGVNTDFLIIVDWSGLMLFNGTYSRPELSFKIEDFWYAFDRNQFHEIQIANDSIGKKIYITLPEPFRQFVLYADYGNGLDAKNIRWAKWLFDAKISSLCLIEVNKLILGSNEI